MNQPLVTRFLDIRDIPALLKLETRQWQDHQAADAETLHKRIESHPQLCIGSFCAHSGEVLASLFMRPISQQELQQARSWTDCAVGTGNTSLANCGGSLFGISLTSVDPDAVSAICEFFWPLALKNGWHEIYFGSPIPGLERALLADPSLDVTSYVKSRRGGLPRDPQLRYYHGRGIQEIVAVLPNYFPHAASLNYGVMLRCRVPFSRWQSLWALLPKGLLQAVVRWLFILSGVSAGRPKPPSGLEGVNP